MSDYVSYIRSKVGQDSILLPFASGILTGNAGQVLLQKRADMNKWGLPGGCMELGESSVDTLIREFYEETGIKVVPIKLLNVYTNFETIFPNGDRAQTVGIIYEVKSTSPFDIHGIKNDETLELAFFSKDDIKILELATRQHQVIIEDFFSGEFKLGH